MSGYLRLSNAGNAVRLCAVATIAVNLIALTAMLTGDRLLVADHAWRILPAGLAVMLLPGLTFGEYIGMRATTIFEVIAKSFAISLIFAVGLTFVILILHLTITVWVSVVLVWNVTWGVLLLVWKSESIFLGPALESVLRPGQWSDRAFFIVIALLGFALYRAADDVTHVSWETGNLVNYARQASSGLALDFNTITLRPDVKLHNGFFIWQFMLGAVSKLAGVDSLIAAFRSRWLLPVVGFSAFFFFAQNLTGTVGRARLIVWVTAILIVSQFIAIEPNPLVRASLGDRPLFAFLGGVHHSDAAFDILLPLLSGYMFLFLRTGELRSLAMLASLILASFFFHPREYFQVMWYGIVAALTSIVLASQNFRTPGREPVAPHDNNPSDSSPAFQRYLYLGGMFVVVAVLLLCVTAFLGAGGQQSAEFGEKRQLIYDLLSPLKLLSAESFLNFNMYGYGGSPPNPPYVYSWLALAALLLPAIAVAGSELDRKIGMMLIILWWLTTGFLLSQHILLILTYSEILQTKVRFLPLFTYPVIAIGWITMLNLVYGLWPIGAQRLKGILTIGACAGAGGIFAVAWHLDAPEFYVLRPICVVLIVISALVIILRTWEPQLWQHLGYRLVNLAEPRRQPGLLLTVVALLAFVLPVSVPAATRFARILLGPSSLTTMFTDANPTGLSQRTIEFIRKEIPPRSRVQVDPASDQLLGIFAPVYQFPFPHGQISLDGDEIQARANDKHPIYNGRTQAGQFDLSALTGYLARKKIEYILSQREFRDGLKTLAATHPDKFAVVFDDPPSGDIILRVR